MLCGGGIGSEFEKFDFSHEGVKRVVGLFMSLVHAIASAPCDFLYLNNQYIIFFFLKKKKTPISLVLYATWYFFHDSGTSEYNVSYSEVQDPRQEPTNPDPDLPLCDQP